MKPGVRQHSALAWAQRKCASERELKRNQARDFRLWVLGATLLLALRWTPPERRFVLRWDEDEVALGSGRGRLAIQMARASLLASFRRGAEPFSLAHRFWWKADL